MSQIYIYSGPVHSGKTSCLEKWISKIPSVGGILAPVINGQRHLRFLSDGQLFSLESDSVDSDLVQQIGKYKFLNSVFHKAQLYLQSLIKQSPEWILIDEIGPLEMAGKGLEPAVSQLIEKLDSIRNINIILVIRDTLVDTAVKYYKLEKHKIKIFNPENKIS